MTTAAHERGEDGTKAALWRSLDQQRAHMLATVEGLTDAQLREPMLPSGWSLLGLVNHLALDVERYWFGCIVGGAPIAEGNAWQVGDAESSASILERYRTEAKAADAVLESVSLDDAPAQRDEWWGDWQVPDVRFVLLHVLTETAAHAGHADAARELIDGSQYIVL